MKLLDIINAPWAIQPEMLEEIQGIYLTHLRGEKIDIKGVEARLGQSLNNVQQDYEVRDGVAIIEAHGVLAKRMNMFMNISGGTSTELIARDIHAAVADPEVMSIILDIDSPGGTVDGMQELAEVIYSARGEKPIVAFTDGVMASAAYYLGAATDAVYISGDLVSVGSIGVITKHIDISKAEEKAGVKSTEIYAGKFKSIGSRHEPLSQEGRADIQARVDYMYSIFVRDIARYRGESVETVLADMADGRIFIGQQAIDAGLVDGVSTFDGLVDKLAGGDSATFNTREVKAMTLTVENLKAQHADVYQAVLAEGKALGMADGKVALVEGHKTELTAAVVAARSEGITEGAAAEMQRIKDVEAQAMPGHAELIAGLKFDGKTTGPEAALQVLAAEKTALAQRGANLKEDAAGIHVPPVDGEGADAAGKDFESLVSACMTEKEISRGKAISVIARSHTEAHTAWKKKINKDKEDADV